MELNIGSALPQRGYHKPPPWRHLGAYSVVLRINRLSAMMSEQGNQNDERDGHAQEIE
jgi:hypothetical protein